ncbi:MAG TPA: AAA family ATPase [Acidimicrobiales bacterium]|nr:AAA family ATPase [Acidimicrobiales bacterium]
MQDVLTFLLTEFDPRSQPPLDRSVGELLRETVQDAGGDLMDTGSEADPPAVLAAVFHVAGDAALTAVKLSRLLTESPQTAIRMALCTGEVTDDVAGGGTPALSRATELLRFAAPQQILATASTAVMASPALPVGAELVDRGIRVLGRRQPPERIYELHPGNAGVETRDRADDGGPSNLEWARRAARGPVLGREEPLEALATAWKATLYGNRRTVLLAGEGGIGKTTVAAELALRLHAEGALVLYGRWDQRALAPYQAVREALGTYAAACPTARLRADLEGWGDEITRLLPDVGARVGGVRAPLMGDPDGERMRLFEAIEAWLTVLARRRPVLLVLDDLHWADGSSLLLVDHLRHSPGEAPLMIVATSREDENQGDANVLGFGPAPTPAQSSTPAGGPDGGSDGDGLVERIGLAGLGRTAVAHLVEQAIGRPLDDSDDDLIEWLGGETAGNPLFVQEVLRSVSGSRDAAAALRTARREVPERLTDVVRWRLKQLPAQARLVLADAAVIGTTFDLELLSGATATPPVQLNAPLDHALRSGLLRHHSPGERYAFAHEVVQRALRDDLDADRAAGLHRRIATTLAGRALAGGDVSAAEVAYHHLRGADASTATAAIRWARNAAEAARRETAFEAAVNLLTRAVEVHDTLVTPFGTEGGSDAYAAVSCELRLELAEALDRAGEFTARDHWHGEAAESASLIDRNDRFVRAALGYGGRLPAATPPNPRARHLLEEALERMPDEDSRNRALVLARLAQVRSLDAPYDERRARSDEAVAMARRMDARVVLATVLMARCLTLDGPDETEEQLTTGIEVTRIGEQTGDPDLALQGARVRISALFLLGRHDEARELADGFITLARQVRHPDHLRIAAMWEILWVGLSGDSERAQDLARTLRRELEAAGHPQAREIHFAQSFALRWLHGGLDRMRTVVDTELTRRPDDVQMWTFSLWLDAATGHGDRALAHLAERDPAEFVAGLAPELRWSLKLVACSVAASAGDPGWAAVLHDALEPYSGRNCVIAYTTFVGAIDHHLGTLALVLGRDDRAVELLGCGLDQHRDLRAEPFVALSARWLARALVQRGRADDRLRAAELQSESLALAERFGLHGLPQFVELDGLGGLDN